MSSTMSAQCRAEYIINKTAQNYCYQKKKGGKAEGKRMKGLGVEVRRSCSCTIDSYPVFTVWPSFASWRSPSFGLT